MQLSERIEERLQALGMTQAELARRAGIPQSTMNSMIRRGRRSSPHLVKIARELQTTAAYLTGDSNDPDSEGAAPEITAEERDWLDVLRAIAPKDRKAMMHLARTLARVSADTVRGRALSAEPAHVG